MTRGGKTQATRIWTEDVLRNNPRADATVIDTDAVITHRATGGDEPCPCGCGIRGARPMRVVGHGPGGAIDVGEGKPG